MSLRTSRVNLLCLALVAASFIATAAVYRRLPERMPSHWNLAGQVNGYVSKPWGPFLLPLVMAGLYALFVVIRRASPKDYRVEAFGGVLEIVEAATLAFTLTLTIVVLLVALGHAVSMPRVITPAVGLLFVVLGSFMSKFTRNFFVGIRTPWTLASEEVWLRTHRLGGKLWVAGGLVLIVSGVLGGPPTLLLFVPLAIAGVPMVYSYLIYRRLERPTK
jgi:immunity protein, SdpI family